MEEKNENLTKVSNVGEDLKLKRDEIIGENRKNNREESLMKKRKEKIIANDILFNDNSSEKEDFQNIKVGLLSNNLQRKLNSTIKIRKMLSVQKNAPIDEVIKAGIIPIFLDFLKNTQEKQLQFEAAWVLTNVASGTSDQTSVIVNGGAIPLFIDLLKSPVKNIKEQSIWALGNITGDSPQNRDLVLEGGVLKPLIEELNFSQGISFTRNSIWTLSNLCRGKPGPKVNYLRQIISVLGKFIFSEDSGVLADVCWAFSYISDGSRERIQLVIESGSLLRITELLMHSETIVQTPALRVIGNIATGDDTQTQAIINCGALPCLLTLLSSYFKSIKKEACWTISNITAGNPQQIQSVIDANIIPTLIYILKHSEIEIKKEAAWAISNATSGGISKQINYMVKQDCLGPMSDLLSSSDVRIIRVVLDGLENILEIGKKKATGNFPNKFSKIIESEGGLEKLENLQYHQNNDIYEQSVRILEKFFGAEEDISEISENYLSREKGLTSEEQIPACSFLFKNN